MRVTIARWAAAIFACCAFVGAVLLPIPKTAKTPWFENYPAPLSASMESLADAAAELNAAVRDYRVAQALTRWKAIRTHDAVHIDASTPPTVAVFMRDVAQEQWRRAGNTASATHAAIFVYFDTSTIATLASPAGRRVAEPRRPADVWYALPEITDGERCVVIVRVRATVVSSLTHLRERSLLGPCGYYAAFGKPGAAVQRWLDATDYRAARLPDWDKPRVPAADPNAVYTLGGGAARCLTGVTSLCASALRLGSTNAAATRLVDGNSSGESRNDRTVSLGDASPRFLADAVREFGQPRFAQFWTTSAPLDSAFVKASGMSIERWTRRWLEATYGERRDPPAVRARDVLWLAIALPVLFVIAASRRESVLVERFWLTPTTSQ